MVVCVGKVYRAMDNLLNCDYNGSENKYTLLVHLHLSNEHALFLEVAQLMSRDPNDVPANHLHEMWIRLSISN